jgi:methionine-S-sulfoxide reductase
MERELDLPRIVHLTHTDIDSDPRILRAIYSGINAGHQVTGIGIAQGEKITDTSNSSLPGSIVNLTRPKYLRRKSLQVNNWDVSEHLEVSSGKTGHREAVQITFDPEVISYAELMDIFWQTFDPTDVGGSFFDRGTQYESAIFFHTDLQRKVAEESKSRLEKSGKFTKPIATPVIKFSSFYPAEEYHQDYYKKEPNVPVVLNDQNLLFRITVLLNKCY